MVVIISRAARLNGPLMNDLLWSLLTIFIIATRAFSVIRTTRASNLFVIEVPVSFIIYRTIPRLTAPSSIGTGGLCCYYRLSQSEHFGRDSSPRSPVINSSRFIVFSSRPVEWSVLSLDYGATAACRSTAMRSGSFDGVTTCGCNRRVL